ncbi:MAG: flagellar biosynthesis repressor FlbT [Robiginitomaculum sp.]|nr:MAG: flagellar biosynthesis repressor FlbT [Robiginitomaculum sp.]
MSGLVLSLRADEKFLVNGALVQNGAKRGQIRLPDNSVNVLRLSDCLHPDEINTPVRRAYYLAQLILSGDTPQTKGGIDLLASLSGLGQVFKATSLEEQINKAAIDAQRGRYYSVLVTLKRLLPIEQKMLQNAHTPTQGRQTLSIKKTG